MKKVERNIEWLLSLTPHQFAGASKKIETKQIEKAKDSLRIFWSNPENRSLHSARMREIKKSWSWNGSRSGSANPNAIPVVTPAGVFGSIADAGLHMGITGEAIRWRIKSKWPGYGYKGGELYMGPKKSHSAYRWVKTPLGTFYTLVAAAKALNVTTVTVRDRIKRKVDGYQCL
jgi:hypothetical protein